MAGGQNWKNRNLPWPVRTPEPIPRKAPGRPQGGPFLALAAGEFIASDDCLPRLLGVLGREFEEGAGSDIAIWRGLRLVVVLTTDGREVWIGPRPRPAA